MKIKIFSALSLVSIRISGSFQVLEHQSSKDEILLSPVYVCKVQIDDFLEQNTCIHFLHWQHPSQSKTILRAYRAYHGANNFHPSDESWISGMVPPGGLFTWWLYLVPGGFYICIFTNHHIKIVLHFIPIDLLCDNFTFVNSILQVRFVKRWPYQLCHVFDWKNLEEPRSEEQRSEEPRSEEPWSTELFLRLVQTLAFYFWKQCRKKTDPTYNNSESEWQIHFDRLQIDWKIEGSPIRH